MNRLGAGVAAYVTSSTQRRGRETAVGSLAILSLMAFVAPVSTTAFGQDTLTVPSKQPAPPGVPRQPSSESRAQQNATGTAVLGKPTIIPRSQSSGGSSAYTTAVPRKPSAVDLHYKQKGPGRDNAYFERNEENYDYLRDPSQRTDFWDPVKNIPLTSDDGVYLSLNGEVRGYYEYYEHNHFGVAQSTTRNGTPIPTQSDQNFYFSRLQLGAMLNVHDWLLGYVELINGQEAATHAGDEFPGVLNNDLTLTQGYVELRNINSDIWYGARLGRQVIYLGNTLYIGSSPLTNIPSTIFDAARGYVDGEWFRIDAFYGALVDFYDTRALSASTNDGNTMWGLYSSFDLRPRKTSLGTLKSTIEPFYFGYRAEPSGNNPGDYYYDDALLVPGSPITPMPGSGVGPAQLDVRHTLGVRYFGSIDRFDWDWQAAWQGGTYGNYSVDAFQLNTETGYLLSTQYWRPRLAVRFNVASGGASKADGQIYTFQPLQTAPFYYAEGDAIAPANIFNVMPRITIRPAHGVIVTFQDSVFWRYSVNDAVYNGIWSAAVTPETYGLTAYNHASYIGHQAELTADWALDRHISMEWVLTDFVPGAAMRLAGGKNTAYGRYIVSYKF